MKQIFSLILAIAFVAFLPVQAVDAFAANITGQFVSAPATVTVGQDFSIIYRCNNQSTFPLSNVSLVYSSIIDPINSDYLSQGAINPISATVASVTLIVDPISGFDYNIYGDEANMVGVAAGASVDFTLGVRQHAGLLADTNVAITSQCSSEYGSASATQTIVRTVAPPPQPAPAPQPQPTPAPAPQPAPEPAPAVLEETELPEEVEEEVPAPTVEEQVVAPEEDQTQKRFIIVSIVVVSGMVIAALIAAVLWRLGLLSKFLPTIF